METQINRNIAEIEVSFKSKIKPSEREKVLNSKDAETVFRRLWNENTMELCEEFYILLLNRANSVLGWYLLSKGGITGTVVDTRLVYAIALKGLATSIVLAHNHPSGNLKPSNEDIKLTRRLKDIGDLLDIPIVDHLIITTESYYSFADDGML